MKKILIIEDDASLILGLESSLKGEGYETFTACTGPDGLRLAEERQPDLLILDLMLPGMSGFEICKRLRDDGNTANHAHLQSRRGRQSARLGVGRRRLRYQAVQFARASGTRECPSAASG